VIDRPKPVIHVPRGTRPPPGWERTTPRRSWVSAPTQIATLPQHHPEKAYAVVSEAGGVPFIIPGFGEIYTEELLELAELYRERENALAGEREASKAERRHAFQEAFSDHMHAKIERHKRNHRTNPLPNHTLPDEKRLY
jgi:hypothetical protein